MGAFLAAITALAQMVTEILRWKVFTYRDRTQDEIKTLLDLHTPAADLRARMLANRLASGLAVEQIGAPRPPDGETKGGS